MLLVVQVMVLALEVVFLEMALVVERELVALPEELFLEMVRSWRCRQG